MRREILKRNLLYTFFLVGFLTGDLCLLQSAFARSNCAADENIKFHVSATYNSTFNYLPTSNAEKILRETVNNVKNTHLKCTGSNRLYAVTSASNGPTMNDILPFGSPGLGLRLLINGRAFVGTQELGKSFRFDTITMQLMQTGVIPPGITSMLNHNAGSIEIYGTDDPVNPVATISLGTNGRALFSDIRCRLDETITQVMLRSVVLSEFKGVGTRLAPQSFRININKCAPSNYKLVYRIDPMSTSFGQGISGLSHDSTATGIGVQILNSGLKPLEFGTDYPVSGSGLYRNIDFHAAYYQLENKPTAGTVNASFMLTLLVN